MKRPKPKPRKKPRKKTRKARRPNPLYGKPQPPSISPFFNDPIILHHIASTLFRYLELMHPVETEIMRALEPSKTDAEFPDEGEKPK